MSRLLLAIPLLLTGCASFGDMTDQQKIYGGTRYIGSQVDQPAVMGPCASCGPYWLFDLPLSFAVDTALLPVTVVIAVFRGPSEESDPKRK